MKLLDIDQRSDEWNSFRKGKITGTKLGKIVVKRGNGRKIGFYELIAERLTLDEDGDESAMDRGIRLEDEALDQFVKETGKVIERGKVVVSDFSDYVMLSPDALIKVGDKYKEAVEVKCLKPAHHIYAIVENKVPDEYEFQILQYFIVNDDLFTLHFVFYDPRIQARPYHRIEFTREQLFDDIEKYRQYQITTLQEVNEIVEQLAF